MFFLIIIFIACKFLIKEVCAVSQNSLAVSPIDEQQISIPFNYTLNKVNFFVNKLIKLFM